MYSLQQLLGLSQVDLTGKTSRRKSPQGIVCKCPDHHSQRPPQFDLLKTNKQKKILSLYLLSCSQHILFYFFFFLHFEWTKNKRTQISKAYICMLQAVWWLCSLQLIESILQEYTLNCSSGTIMALSKTHTHTWRQFYFTTISTLTSGGHTVEGGSVWWVGGGAWSQRICRDVVMFSTPLQLQW